MAGIYETLAQSNADRLAQQAALAQTPAQKAGVAVRGAIDDVGAVVATPLIGAAGIASDAWTGAKNFGAGVVGLSAPPKVTATPTAAPGVADAKATGDAIKQKYFTAPPADFDATVKAAALTNLGATPPVTVNQGTAFNPTPLTANAPRGVYNSENTPGAVGSNTATPAAAPAMRAPAMNEGLLAAQQNIMRQIGDAQAVVSAGSNRDGYKMGDVTKALMTMNALNPTLNSINGLMGQSYGVDASMFNHAADNTTRTNIATASNANEIAKTHIAGGYGLQKAVEDNKAATALATHKAVLDANSPAGQAKQAQALRDMQDYNAIATGGYGVIAPKYHINDATGDVYVNGVLVDKEAAKRAQAQKK